MHFPFPLTRVPLAGAVLSVLALIAVMIAFSGKPNQTQTVLD